MLITISKQKVVTRSQARNEPNSITPIGIDSQATITVINDESYFSTWDKQTRTLIAFNQKETRNVKIGIVDLKLVDKNEENCISLQLRAAYVPHSPNLLCMYDILKSDINIWTTLDQPKMIWSNKIISLTWDQKLLAGTYLCPSNHFIAATFEDWHNRLGHAHSAAIEK